MKVFWRHRWERMFFARNNDGGFVMPLALLVMLLIFSATGMMLTASFFSLRESSDYKTYQTAVLLGKNAVEECHAALVEDVTYAGTAGDRPLANGAVERITVSKPFSQTRNVMIWVTYKGYRRRYTGTALFSSSDPQSAFLQNFSVHLYSKGNE